MNGQKAALEILSSINAPQIPQSTCWEQMTAPGHTRLMHGIRALGNSKMNTSQKMFDDLSNAEWKNKFYDPCTGNWHEKWFLDGLRATVDNTPKGMVFSAGPLAGDFSCHAVLWTKDSFTGDIKIEYDYTKIDTTHDSEVNILYIQATGIGKEPYLKDISKWSELREIPDEIIKI